MIRLIQNVYARCAPVGLTLMITATASGQAPHIGPPATSAVVTRDAALIDSIASRMFALDASPGMAVVVVRDTQVVYLKGLGYAWHLKMADRSFFGSPTRANTETTRIWVEAYAGTYESPVFGRLELRVVSGKLEARAGGAWSASCATSCSAAASWRR
jgi:CubicO group peptidase (beta-lactamase class C family)